MESQALPFGKRFLDRKRKNFEEEREKESLVILMIWTPFESTFQASAYPIVEKVLIIYLRTAEALGS